MDVAHGASRRCGSAGIEIEDDLFLGVLAGAAQLLALASVMAISRSAAN